MSYAVGKDKLYHQVGVRLPCPGRWAPARFRNPRCQTPAASRHWGWCEAQSGHHFGRVRARRDHAGRWVVGRAGRDAVRQPPLQHTEQPPLGRCRRPRTTSIVQAKSRLVTGKSCTQAAVFDSVTARRRTWMAPSSNYRGWSWRAPRPRPLVCTSPIKAQSFFCPAKSTATSSQKCKKMHQSKTLPGVDRSW